MIIGIVHFQDGHRRPMLWPDEVLTSNWKLAAMKTNANQGDERVKITKIEVSKPQRLEYPYFEHMGHKIGVN